MSASGARLQLAEGVLSVVQPVAQPGAGLNFSFNPPSTRQLISVSATLATSATVANRLPALSIQDNAGHVVATLPASSVQAASLSEQYIWAVGNPFASGNNFNVVPIPTGLVVASNWLITGQTSGIQAGDQWSAVVATYAG